MSLFEMFMKRNKAVKENTKYAATKSLTDEDGSPLLWEIRPLSTKETEDIKDVCTIEVPVKGKPGVYRPKLQLNDYLRKMAAASIVVPDMNDKELQDSYNVMTPEDLLTEMIDNPAEYNDFLTFIQEFNGYETIDDLAEEAKN